MLYAVRITKLFEMCCKSSVYYVWNHGPKWKQLISLLKHSHL